MTKYSTKKKTQFWKTYKIVSGLSIFIGLLLFILKSKSDFEPFGLFSEALPWISIISGALMFIMGNSKLQKIKNDSITISSTNLSLNHNNTSYNFSIKKPPRSIQFLKDRIKIEIAKSQFLNIDLGDYFKYSYERKKLVNELNNFMNTIDN